MPAPVPTALPTVTPSSTPTSNPTGITITAESATPLIGVLKYGETTGIGTAQWATDYTGRFPSLEPRVLPGGVVSVGFIPDYERALYRLSATGVDRGSRLLVSATAPAGATVVSPLTSLVDSAGSQTVVRSALQMNAGAYTLPVLTDLTNTSGVQTDSGPLAAANVRALMLSQAVYVVGRGAGALDYIPFNLASREAQIGAFIRANPTVLLYTEAGAAQLLRANGDRSVDDAAYQAIAHLVAVYAEASQAVQADLGQGTRYMLGLQGFFLYWAAQVRTVPSASATVQGFTAATVAAAVGTFADYPAFTATGTLFAGPDFDFLAPGASGARERWDRSRNGSGQIRTPGYAENDFTLNPDTLSFDTVYTRGGLVSVTVPPANAAQISATANGATIVYRALPGFVGVTYFDYTISDDRGQQATARFYIVVR